MRGICTLILLCGMFLSAAGQQTTMGVRVGTPNGLSLKHYFNDASAIEGIIGARKIGVSLTGLYVHHSTAFMVDQLKWMYGGGGHAGFYERKSKNFEWLEYKNKLGRFSLGIDGLLGLEYDMNALPVKVSLDYKPAITFSGFKVFLYGDAALTIRVKL